MTFCVGPRRLRGYLLSFTVSKSTFLRPQDRLDQRFDRRRAGSAIDVRLAAHDIFVCVRKRAGRRDVDPLETDLQRAPLCRARCAANGTVVERNGSISGVPVATPAASPGSYMPEITAICPWGVFCWSARALVKTSCYSSGVVRTRRPKIRSNRCAKRGHASGLTSRGGRSPRSRPTT